MAQTDVGPNDIVIHLVNPFKCGSCGTEFFLRSMFMEHLGEHIDKQKSQNPCSQIVCGVSIASKTDNGITVTRDILQINENQMFELQDPSLDYSQLAPLRTLEQAGILSLPPRPLDTIKQEKDLSFITDNIDLIPDANKMSLLSKNHSISLLQTDRAQVEMEIIDPSLISSQVEEQNTNMFESKSSDDANIADLDSEMGSGVMQALFSDGKMKNQYSVMIQAPSSLTEQLEPSSVEPAQLYLSHTPTTFINESLRSQSFFEEKSILGKKKKKPTCHICFMEFPNQYAVDRHQVVHNGEKPHRCMHCFKVFGDISTLRKHSLLHKRQHRCPICHRLYLKKVQLIMHMKNHGKKRFIQFGNTFHEVKVKMSRNEHGQTVQQYSLMMLLGEEEKQSLENIDDPPVEDIDEELDVQLLIKEQMEKGCEDMTEELTKTESFSKGTDTRDISDQMDDSVALHQDESSTRKKVIYKCGHCQKIIFTRPTLSRHLIRHTNRRPFTCEHCSKSFRHKSDLVHHYKTHTKPVKCPTCTAAFSKALYLDKHLEKGCPNNSVDNRFTVLDDQRCQCNLCNRVLKSKTNMLRHLKVHAFDERAKSEKQTKESSNTPETVQSENVEDHYTALEESVGFSCNICGQLFRFRSFIKTHILMHLDIKLFKCPECNKKFFARHMLKKHLQNHTRPYACPVCNKGFIRRYLMTQHFKKKHEDGKEDDMEDITVLEDQRLLSCDICGKTMKSYQRSLMKYHVRMHKDVRPFECTECQKTFSSDNALKKHALNHTRPYVCQVCNKGFSRRYLLTDHYRKKCSKSEHSLIEKTNPQPISEDLNQTEDEHLEAESSTPYQASVITQAHPGSGREIYVCEPCDKSFTVYETLLRHMNTFARPTSCKHCRKIFEDKHLSLVHQRSCLGSTVIVKNTPKMKKESGKNQEKVKRIRSEVKKTIEAVTANSNEVIHLQIVENQEAPQDKIGDVSNHFDSADCESSLGTTANSLSLVKQKTISIVQGFPCPECDKHFGTARGLKIHAHTHLRMYKCDRCCQDFAMLKELREHTASNCGANLNKSRLETAEHHEEKNCSALKIDNLDNDNSIAVLEMVDVKEGNGGSFIITSQHNIIQDIKKESDSEEDLMSERAVEHKDLESVSARLMQTGTRGRPFSCQQCRRRFTDKEGLEAHVIQIHGAK